ncbi:MAG: hypothetical protein KIT74_09765 [Fimbriimonadales bacterium]|nr:hypothetical protein [Fimbriimonadales bacterium]
MRWVGSLMLLVAALVACAAASGIGYYAFYIRFRIAHGWTGTLEVLLLATVSILAFALSYQLIASAWAVCKRR